MKNPDTKCITGERFPIAGHAVKVSCQKSDTSVVGFIVSDEAEASIRPEP